METVKPGAEQKGLHHYNQVASFEYSERQAAVSARVAGCVARAFHAIGASPATQEVIYWNLYMTRNIERNDIMDNPAEFIAGVKAIYGEAGIVVFEYMLRREIKREFGLSDALKGDPAKEGDACGLMNLIAYSASESYDEL